MNKIKTILMSVLTLTILFLFTQETKAQRFSHMTTPSVSTDWIELNPNVDYGKDYTEWANQQNQYIINEMMTQLTDAFNQSKSTNTNFFSNSFSKSSSNNNSFDNFSINKCDKSGTTIINNYYNTESQSSSIMEFMKQMDMNANRYK